ncbi:Glycine betaine/L-proline transport system binding protein proX [Granulibacter bethesdensis]|uniref:Glycine betaine/L-proline transport system binding protein proX n=2 Tax=Granulibacter bethesdensis TaxID=364410 RepID=Q0BW20_GRABC|nr:Glycine betaine/L-proline transport system binding protein proX [Granulibacter bethesdensis CGDNIH1]AHJ64446.1 Glycine betaine/L-proline transport system binding protein proX [Granulibacter bethesdensis CGDNIH4]AHJ67066.1 Glycine betaine/L-proline transport system binding protein proX [Granulibacter bethesdensis]APH50750.1 Glycine betaine/L-proline transport system binding protein proX [Granulibacter bethesdensis]APH58368.1 Glycine betaine/L-proline transport system binding protein proX [Gra
MRRFMAGVGDSLALCIDGGMNMLNSVTARLRAVLMAGVSFGLFASTAAQADPSSCRKVRLSDIGWTDVSATTAVTAALLKDLGYRPDVALLSLPVTYRSLADKQLDVFTGNWMPSGAADRKPYEASLDIIGPNLTGAKYTLAVPAYLYDAGLHDFADISKFADKLGNKIYGIEPGNDGNRHILEMIGSNANNLGKFKLIESSEQGMLAEIDRKIRNKEPIVFLGWEPHPMNTLYKIQYLTGGDKEFGPNYGGAEIFTNTWKGYSEKCPNVGKLLHNMHFSLDGENKMMDAIMNHHVDPPKAAKAWLRSNPDTVKTWLDGVTTYDGSPGWEAVKAKLGD